MHGCTSKDGGIIEFSKGNPSLYFSAIVCPAVIILTIEFEALDKCFGKLEKFGLRSMVIYFVHFPLCEILHIIWNSGIGSELDIKAKYVIYFALLIVLCEAIYRVMKLRKRKPSPVMN